MNLEQQRGPDQAPILEAAKQEVQKYPFANEELEAIKELVGDYARDGESVYHAVQSAMMALRRFRAREEEQDQASNRAYTATRLRDQHAAAALRPTAAQMHQRSEDADKIMIRRAIFEAAGQGLFWIGHNLPWDHPELADLAKDGYVIEAASSYPDSTNRRGGKISW